MITLRRGTFETNSSSTHSLTVCSKSDYDAWLNGDMYWDRWNEELISKEEVEKKYKEHCEYEKAHGNEPDKFEYWAERFYTFEKYQYYIDMETYEVNYTSKSGDELVIFGYYGYDG